MNNAPFVTPSRASLRQRDSDRCESVLIVEDTPAIAKLLGHFLAPLAQEIDVVGDGLAAVERVIRRARLGRAFDVILMDIQMPVMSGLEATRVIRSCGVDTPIIAVSAGIHSRERCLDAGCDAYLTKPIDRRDFMEQIHEVLTLRR